LWNAVAVIRRHERAVGELDGRGISAIGRPLELDQPRRGLPGATLVIAHASPDTLVVGLANPVGENDAAAGESRQVAGVLAWPRRAGSPARRPRRRRGSDSPRLAAARPRRFAPRSARHPTSGRPKPEGSCRAGRFLPSPTRAR